MNETLKCIDLYNRNLTKEEKCNWISQVDDCYTKSYINYLNIFFCSANDSIYWFKFFLLILWATYLFVAIQTIASLFMCTSLLKISKQLKLSENLSSVTLFSFGVATPCIFSAISGILNEKPQIVIGALFGSASFITQLIIGSIFALKSFRIEILPFLRDVLVYIILILWIFYIFLIKKQIDRFDAFGFLIFYVIYIVIAFITPRNQDLKDDEEDDIDDEIGFELSTISNSLDITPVDDDKDLTKSQRICKIFFNILTPFEEKEWSNSNLTQKIILVIKIPILFIVKLTSPAIDNKKTLNKLTIELKFRMFIQMILGPQLILEIFSLNNDSYLIREDIPISTSIFIISIFFALFFYYFVNNPKIFEIYSTWHSFIMSVFWVYLFCEEAVSYLNALSITLRLSSEFIGLTILAWGNASLDLFADIKIVLEGKPRLASSATIIAPFISLLLGIGIPGTLLFLTKRDLGYLPVNLSEQMFVMFVSVTIGLILTTLHLILNNFKVWRLYGGFIILIYLITIILEFTLEFNVWHLPISILNFKV